MSHVALTITDLAVSVPWDERLLGTKRCRWRTAAWTPDATVAGADGRVQPEAVWAALDCPSGIAGTTVVLGRMAATVGALPRPGDRCRDEPSARRW